MRRMSPWWASKRNRPSSVRLRRVAAELLAGVFQLLVGARDLELAQQADGDRLGQVVEVLLAARRGRRRPSRSARAWRLLTTQRPGLDWASARSRSRQVGIEQAAGLRAADRLLQRLEAVEDQQRALLADEVGEPRAPCRVSRGRPSSRRRRSAPARRSRRRCRCGRWPPRRGRACPGRRSSSRSTRAGRAGRRRRAIACR